MRTSVRSPWQNGVAERWVSSARREMRDHVIPINEHHFCRLGLEYLAYYHEDRTHIGLNNAAPVQAADRTTSLPKRAGFCEYGRYGYRRVTALLNQAGWSVGKDPVQRIWWRRA